MVRSAAPASTSASSRLPRIQASALQPSPIARPSRVRASLDRPAPALRGQSAPAPRPVSPPIGRAGDTPATATPARPLGGRRSAFARAARGAVEYSTLSSCLRPRLPGYAESGTWRRTLELVGRTSRSSCRASLRSGEWPRYWMRSPSSVMSSNDCTLVDLDHDGRLGRESAVSRPPAPSVSGRRTVRPVGPRRRRARGPRREVELGRRRRAPDRRARARRGSARTGSVVAVRARRQRVAQPRERIECAAAAPAAHGAGAARSIVGRHAEARWHSGHWEYIAASRLSVSPRVAGRPTRPQPSRVAVSVDIKPRPVSGCHGIGLFGQQAAESASSPPAGARAANLGASSTSGPARIFASSRSAAAASCAVRRSRSTRSRRRCARRFPGSRSAPAGRCPARCARCCAQLQRGDRQDPAAATVVHHRPAAQVPAVEPLEAHRRGRVRAGAEGEPWIEFDSYCVGVAGRHARPGIPRAGGRNASGGSPLAIPAPRPCPAPGSAVVAPPVMSARADGDRGRVRFSSQTAHEAYRRPERRFAGRRLETGSSAASSRVTELAPSAISASSSGAGSEPPISKVSCSCGTVLLRLFTGWASCDGGWRPVGVFFLRAKKHARWKNTPAAARLRGAWSGFKKGTHPFSGTSKMDASPFLNRAAQATSPGPTLAAAINGEPGRYVTTARMCHGSRHWVRWALRAPCIRKMGTFSCFRQGGRKTGEWPLFPDAQARGIERGIGCFASGHVSSPAGKAPDTPPATAPDASYFNPSRRSRGIVDVRAARTDIHSPARAAAGVEVTRVGRGGLAGYRVLRLRAKKHARWRCRKTGTRLSIRKMGTFSCFSTTLTKTGECPHFPDARRT